MVAPRLVASYQTRGTALQVSEGYRRDRGVDESGNQISIFGRRGARPFNFEEMRRMYLVNGKLFTVTDEPKQNTAADQSKQTESRWLGLARLFTSMLGMLVSLP